MNALNDQQQQPQKNRIRLSIRVDDPAQAMAVVENMLKIAKDMPGKNQRIFITVEAQADFQERVTQLPKDAR